MGWECIQFFEKVAPRRQFAVGTLEGARTKNLIPWTTVVELEDTVEC